MTSGTGSVGTRAGRLPTRSSALLLGLGMGGFVDGIVLHQILQWHHMISSVEGRSVTTLAGLQANTVADGLFHSATWVLTWAGVVTGLVSWRQGRIAPSWSFHLGLVLVGWGIFNLADGIVDHHLLWDIGFLVFGAVLVLGGRLLHRHGVRGLTPRSRSAP
jgi:uncharacterized membrane protein